MFYNKEFLRELDNQQQKEIFAKIIFLSLDEYPIEEISGKITGGSINIDGASAVRRTCSLTMVAAQEVNYYQALQNKFKLEIGVKNFIDKKYPDIIWFPQGIYVCTSWNTSQATNNYTISIQGQDKMCLLNGNVQGSLPSSIDFGTIEEVSYEYSPLPVNQHPANNTDYYIAVQQEDKSYKYLKYTETFSQEEDKDEDGNTITVNKYPKGLTLFTKGNPVRTIISLPIKEIIKNAVHVYGNEKLENIIINDIDDYGLELLEYRGDETLYALIDKNTGLAEELIFGNEKIWYEKNGERKEYEIQKLGTTGNVPNFKFYTTAMNNLPPEAQGEIDVVYITEESTNPQYIYRIEYKETAGYRITELTYAGELIANVGEALTSILDKIKNMLGNFEYFYDLQGRFVFQKQKNYIDTVYSPLKNGEYYENGEIKNGLYSDSLIANSDIAYYFDNGVLITSFNNNPNLNNLKNDYAVWGETESASGTKVPVHMRYAIDIKPMCYKSFIRNETVNYQDKQNNTQNQYIYISNEITNIKDLNLSDSFFDGFVEKDDSNRTDIPLKLIKYVDWREIIYQMATDYYKNNQKDDFALILAKNNFELYPSGRTGYENYYADLQGFWRQIYDENPKEPLIFWGDKNNEQDKIYYNEPWNIDVKRSPSSLLFWFDFFGGQDLDKYSIRAVGARAKSLTDNDVKAIYFKDTPTLIIDTEKNIQKLYEEGAIKTGYSYIQISPAYEDFFTMSGQGKSAKDVIDNLIYNNSYCIDNITLNSIPIYYLEPNTRISVYDEKSGINGEYIMSKISISLNYNGTMSITATKAPERLL